MNIFKFWIHLENQLLLVEIPAGAIIIIIIYFQLIT